MLEFDSNCLPLKFNISEETKSKLIEQNKAIPNVKKVVPVEHFTFDFSGYILQLKFNEIR